MEGASYKSMAVFLVFFISLFTAISRTNGYDALDPHGNITSTWDFMLQNKETYDECRAARMEAQLGMERIRGDLEYEGLRGQSARRQELPHCCLRKPTVIDLMPGAPFNLQVSNCCKAGVLSSMAQDPSSYASAFQMTIEVPAGGRFTMPENFSLVFLGIAVDLLFGSLRVSSALMGAAGGLKLWVSKKGNALASHDLPFF